MILGIGNDICDITRIEKTLARFGEKFEKRVFTRAEIAKARARKGAGPQVVAGTYAKRFAAKEACAKALGTGFGTINWHEVEVVNLESGAPTIYLSGGALEQLQKLTPSGQQARIFLTLTDEYPLAQAHVVIESIPL